MSTEEPKTDPEVSEDRADAVAETYPVDRLRSRVNESLRERPLTVYLVLFAGAATLMLLLGVVWISSRSGDNEQELICTEIAPADARSAILAGEIARINILVDDDRPVESLTGIQLRYADGACRQTPQGADIRAELFGIIGAVELYNQYNDDGVDVHYQAQNIQPELLATSTSTLAPTEEPTVTGTPVPPTETALPPTETAVPTGASPSATDGPTTTGGSPGPRAPIGDPGL